MKIVRLTQEHSFKPFDCGETDLNEFLLQDAKQYAQGLLAVTYVIEDEDMTVAFFSLSNDRISLSESDKATWRRIRSAFREEVHRRRTDGSAPFPAAERRSHAGSLEDTGREGRVFLQVSQAGRRDHGRHYFRG